MAFILALGLGAVAGLFLLIVVGELFYLFYWRKRPLAYPRGNSVPVAPLDDGEPEGATASDAGLGGAGSGHESEVVINVTCAEYQIAALHQDLVEKLFPAVDVSPAESTQDLMGPTRMLFTITEETKEELEGLDIPDGGKGESGGVADGDSGRGELGKSLSDVPISPVSHLSPASTPFATPPSSPDHFVTPNATPSRSPLITLSRVATNQSGDLKSSSPKFMDEQHCKSDCSCCCASPPPAPPSPTRPTFPFLVRAPSPAKSSDFPSGRSTSSSGSSIMHETSASSSDWGGSSSSTSCNFNASAPSFVSPSREPLVLSFPSPSSPGISVVPAKSSRRSLMVNGFPGPEVEEEQVEVRKKGDERRLPRKVLALQSCSNPSSSPLLRACTSVYENSTFSPSSNPSSPDVFPLSSTIVATPTCPKERSYLQYAHIDDNHTGIQDSPPSSPSSTCSSPRSLSPSSSSCSLSPPAVYSRATSLDQFTHSSDLPSPSPPSHLAPCSLNEHSIHVPPSETFPTSCVLNSSRPPTEDLEEEKMTRHSPSRIASRGGTCRPGFQMGR